MKEIKIIISIYFVLPSLFLLASCSHELRSYASIQQIDREGWQRQQEISCQISVYDTLSLFHLDITGRLQHACSLDTLSLIVLVTSPLGESFCDTVSFAVTHSSNRLWEDFRFPYCSHVRLSQAGTWRFSFRHNMDVETLRGVIAVGIFIKKE